MRLRDHDRECEHGWKEHCPNMVEHNDGSWDHCPGGAEVSDDHVPQIMRSWLTAYFNDREDGDVSAG